MDLLAPGLRSALRVNAIQRHVTLDRKRRAAARAGRPEPDPVPVVKLFNPLGPATWLATELANDGDTFGLADFGLGCPEPGGFSLREIAGLHLPLGLRIARDIAFATTYALSIWTHAAHREGAIREAEILLGP